MLIGLWKSVGSIFFHIKATSAHPYGSSVSKMAVWTSLRLSAILALIVLVTGKSVDPPQVVGEFKKSFEKKTLIKSMLYIT